ncbi:unnamed protein product [Parajaminaea phylloscopi]
MTAGGRTSGQVGRWWCREKSTRAVRGNRAAQAEAGVRPDRVPAHTRAGARNFRHIPARTTIRSRAGRMPFLGRGKKKASAGSGDGERAAATSSPGSTAAPPSRLSAPSASVVDIAGLPVTVYGLAELTPSASSSSAPRPPEVCVSFHLHGRGGDAKNEEDIAIRLYEVANEVRHSQSQSSAAPPRELLVVSFDARNHGHRMTNQLGQKGWGAGNQQHAMDLYGMILGISADVSFLVAMLPPYLFPHDDRSITKWCVTGKSLGGHATWHVLKDEPQITVGVSFIGCPDFSKLLEYRTKQAFLLNGPPHVPRSLKALLERRDPAQSAYDRWGPENPYWGKRIMSLSGADDKLVHSSFSRPFLSRLAVSQPHGQGGQQEGLEVDFLEGVRHEVTPAMVERGGQWIGKWGCCQR